jgi:HTH-type transcriptional regulator/antitoxin MqsA
MQGILHDGVRPTSVTYQGTVYQYDQPGAFCDLCGDGMTQESEIDDARWAAFRDAVDARIANEMESIRERLHLSRQDVMVLVGGGKNAFKRYIDRETRPTAAVWNLLRILDKHPELVKELQEPVKLAEFLPGIPFLSSKTHA